MGGMDDHLWLNAEKGVSEMFLAASMLAFSTPDTSTLHGSM